MYDPDTGHPFAPRMSDDHAIALSGAVLEEELPEVSVTVLDPTSRIAMQMQKKHNQKLLLQQEQELLPTLAKMFSSSK